MLRSANPEPQAFASLKQLAARTRGMSLSWRTDCITSTALVHNEMIKARLCVPILVTILRAFVQLPIAEKRVFDLGRKLGMFADDDELPIHWYDDAVEGALKEVLGAADGVLDYEGHLGSRDCWPNEKDRQACLKAVHQIEYTSIILKIDKAKKLGAARRAAASLDAPYPRCACARGSATCTPDSATNHARVRACVVRWGHSAAAGRGQAGHSLQDATRECQEAPCWAAAARARRGSPGLANP